MVGFPRWKIFFIVIAIFLGVYFALPILFLPLSCRRKS